MLTRSLLPLGVVGVLVLAGCSSAGTSPADGARLTIVASTDVYGDIATQIVGDAADVTSIITSAAQDPHSYEASARDRLALAQADLVIENGGGYDPFIDTLLGDDPAATVIDASDVSGLLDDTRSAASGGAQETGTADEAGATDATDHDHVDGFNEHVWYSLDAVEKVARAILDEAQKLDRANAPSYRSNYDAFATQLGALRDRVHALDSRADGHSAAITEPVPLYLLADAGLTNATPPAFSEAIEEGTDVAPAVLRQTLAIFGSGSVVLLAYNAQTAGPETEAVRSAAEAAGVPVVDFTETLPAGDDYLSWMSANVDAIAGALG